LLKPAPGAEGTQGIPAQFTKQAGDPAWADDPEVKDYVALTKKVGAERRPGDFVALFGHAIARAEIAAGTNAAAIATLHLSYHGHYDSYRSGIRRD